MHLLLAELIARPGHGRDVGDVLQGLVDAARTEPGTLHYAVHAPRDEERPFVVYELYEDEAACRRHLDSRPVRDAFVRFDALLAAPPRILFDQAVDVAALPARGAADAPGELRIA